MGGISNRVFGASLPKRVQQKLELRQLLASSASPNESVDLNQKLMDETGNPILVDGSEVSSYRTNFDGTADLSSRTPFVRMWTAVQLERHEYTGRQDVPDDEGETKFTGRERPDHIYVTEGGVVKEKKVHKHERIVYELGNHNYQVTQTPPNERVGDGSSGLDDSALAEVLPNAWETNDNEFFKPPAGITGCSMDTMGALGAMKKTKVKFVVHNFHDFDVIYSKHFMKPGAQVVIDFGWDTSDLYNPRQIADETQWTSLGRGKNLDDIFYGEKGYVTTSNGDLETLIGFVTKYNSTYRDDGGIDCEVEITSKNSALVSHEYGEGQEDLRERIIQNLDYEIVNYAEEYFKGDYLSKDKSYTAEKDEEWQEVADQFASNNLTGTTRNVPGQISLTTGVYWQTWMGDDDYSESGLRSSQEEAVETKRDELEDAEEDGTSNGKNLYVSWGWFEDKILNLQFGVGKDVDDILYGKDLSARFDSSNTYTRFDPYLFRRQKETMEGTNRKFLYPEFWSSTYNTERSKVPDNKKTLGGKFIGGQIAGDRDLKRAWGSGRGDINKGRIPLRELFIQVDIIKTGLKSNNSINDFVKFVCGEISGDSAGTIDLQMSSNNYASTEMSVIDKNYVNLDPELAANDKDPLTGETLGMLKNMFIFRPHSPNSMVKKTNISFQTPKNGMSSMIAIQGMGSGDALTPLTMEIDRQLALRSIDEWNDKYQEFGTRYLPEVGKYPTKRIKKNVVSDSTALLNFASGDKVLAKKKSGSWSSQQSGLYSAGRITDIAWATSDVYGINDVLGVAANPVGAAWDWMFGDEEEEENEEVEEYGSATVVGTMEEFYTSLCKNNYFQENLSSILPIKLELEIYGISSISPGDVFRVDYLPRRYLNKVYFQVTKVSHDVQSSWTTKLATVMRISHDAKMKSKVYARPKDVFLAKKVIEDFDLVSPYSMIANVLSRVQIVPNFAIEGKDFSTIDYIFEFTATKNVNMSGWTDSKFGNGKNVPGGEKNQKKIGSLGKVGAGQHVYLEWSPPYKVKTSKIPLIGPWIGDTSIGGWDLKMKGKLKKGYRYRIMINGGYWVITDADDRYPTSYTKQIEKLFYVYSDWASAAQAGQNFKRDIGRWFGF